MPTKRTRRARNRRVPVPADLYSWLADENPNYTGHYFLTDLELRAAWDEVKAEILETWAREQPGGRPFHWWKLEAPEPRRRIGGTGQAAHEVLANAESYKRGLPTHWITPRDVEDYGPNFKGVAIDSENPPAFESEVTYLDRHGLLLPGEKERLRKSDWEPEFVLPYSEPAEDEPRG